MNYWGPRNENGKVAFKATEAKTDLEKEFPDFKLKPFLKKVQFALRLNEARIYLESFKKNDLGIIQNLNLDTILNFFKLKIFSELELLLKLLNENSNKFKFEIVKTDEENFAIKISYRHRN